MKPRIRYGLVLLLLAPRLASAQGLIIPSGTYVIANTGNIVLQKNWVNNGSFTQNGGTVIFGGTVQTLGGSSPSTFINLTVAAGSNTTIVSPGQIISGVLLSNDTLNANGNLTLLSTATQTALIQGSGTGEVLGNLTMQRYLDTGFGYKYFSSPFHSDTVGNFSSVVNLGASFPDVYGYNENLASAGWVNYTTSSDLLVPLAGYAVNFGSSFAPLTVSLTGVVNNHTLSATLYNHNQVYTLGFNLVGNPYPSPVDWNSAMGWTKTNIDNALYFFSAGNTDQYTGTYSSYINGVSSNGIASNIIAAMQGFFIHVSNGAYPVTGLLSVNNNARNTNSDVIFLGNPGPPEPLPLLRLSAGFVDEGLPSDPVVIYFKDAATGSFDKDLDALKLMNTHTGVPSLYTVATDTSRLSIQALPFPGANMKVVPLGLMTAQDGWITFQAGDIQGMPAALHIYLSDIQAGIDQDLTREPSYRLYLAKGEYKNRFFLKFSPNALADTSASANGGTNGAFQAYSADGKVVIKSNLPAGESGNLIILDMAGRIIYREQINDNGYHVINMTTVAAGIYVVSFATGHEINSIKIFAGEQP
jgi:hypothetical protein